MSASLNSFLERNMTKSPSPSLNFKGFIRLRRLAPNSRITFGSRGSLKRRAYASTMEVSALQHFLACGRVGMEESYQWCVPRRFPSSCQLVTTTATKRRSPHPFHPRFDSSTHSYSILRQSSPNRSPLKTLPSSGRLFRHPRAQSKADIALEDG